MHETPSNDIFQEMKDTAKMIWSTYDNQFGYVDEKLEKINGIDNVQDNAMVFYRMFDMNNQSSFIDNSTEKVLTYIFNNK